jgi:hypothetical protein
MHTIHSTLHVPLFCVPLHLQARVTIQLCTHIAEQLLLIHVVCEYVLYAFHTQAVAEVTVTEDAVTQACTHCIQQHYYADWHICYCWFSVGWRGTCC